MPCSNRYRVERIPGLPRAVVLCFAVFSFVFTSVTTCAGQIRYYVDDSDIESAARRAVSFIENSEDLGVNDTLLGAIVINTVSRRYDYCSAADHPLVVKAINEAIRVLETSLSDEAVTAPSSMNITLAFMLLCDVDSNGLNTSTVTDFLNSYKTRERATTDEQLLLYSYYSTLSLCVANRHGYLPDKESMRNQLVHCMETLENRPWPDGNGAAGKECHDSARQCLLLSEVHFLANQLKLHPDPDGREGLGSHIPVSVTKYSRPVEPLVDDINIERIEAIKAKGAEWISRQYRVLPVEETLCLLTAFESYAYQQRNDETEATVEEYPDWYDHGVELLLRSQNTDGSFVVGNEPDELFSNTCLATLFICRSTETVAAFDPPSSRHIVNFRSRRIDGRGTVQSLQEVLNLLDERGQDRESCRNFIRNFVVQVRSYDPSARIQSAMFSRLVRERNYYKRLAAVEILAAEPEMEHAPHLLFALGDPDLSICRVAHNGLRLISRKIDTVSIPPNATRTDFDRARDEWTQWYLSLRPDATVDNE